MPYYGQPYPPVQTPMMDPMNSQQRMGQMNAMYSPYSQQPVNQMPQQASAPAQLVKGWPVNSMEEAQKAIIDLDGSVFVFPNLPAGEIYTKQVNTTDFSAIFRVYKYQEPPAPPMTAAVAYAAQSEVEELKRTVQVLQERLESINPSQGSKLILPEGSAK